MTPETDMRRLTAISTAALLGTQQARFGLRPCLALAPDDGLKPGAMPWMSF